MCARIHWRCVVMSNGDATRDAMIVEPIRAEKRGHPRIDSVNSLCMRNPHENPPHTAYCGFWLFILYCFRTPLQLCLTYPPAHLADMVKLHST
jgi:hypothetical protein